MVLGTDLGGLQGAKVARGGAALAKQQRTPFRRFHDSHPLPESLGLRAFNNLNPDTNYPRIYSTLLMLAT